VYGASVWCMVYTRGEFNPGCFLQFFSTGFSAVKTSDVVKMQQGDAHGGAELTRVMHMAVLSL
jgi:hypothetical protein